MNHDQVRLKYARLENRRALIIVLVGLGILVAGLLIGGEAGKWMIGGVLAVFLAFLRFMQFGFPNLYDRRDRSKVLEEE